MNFRPFLVPVLVLTASGGLLAWLLLADPPEAPQETAAVARPSETTPAASANTDLPSTSPGEQALVTAPAPAAAAPLPDDIRNVSPDGVSAPRVDGSLKRIEPSKRYLELKDPPIEPIPDGPLELVRVQVLDGGRLKSDRLLVKLAHIAPLDLEETCVSRLGGNWPCGARARTFLRGLIRQFKVTCEKIEDTGPQQILATCNRGSFDLSKRLVRYGWADPAEDAPEEFFELAAAAKEKKVGKWQSEWLAELPRNNWEGNPEDPLPGLEDLEPEIVEWSLRTETVPAEGQRPELELTKVTYTSNAQELADACDVIVLSVPPAQAASLQLAAPDKLIISVMAGVSLEQLTGICGSARVVRAMSSPAARQRLAYSPWTAADGLSDADCETVKVLLSACGPSDRVPDERQIEVFTALTGPVPGFAAFFADALVQYALQNGVEPAIASRAIKQLFLASGEIMSADAEPPAERVREMIDYAGTTAAGLLKVQELDLQRLIAEGLDASTARVRTIAGED
eukprot:g1163.t1